MYFGFRGLAKLCIQGFSTFDKYCSCRLQGECMWAGKGVGVERDVSDVTGDTQRYSELR